MPLKRSLVRGLSLSRRSDDRESTSTTPYFPSAPNKGYDIKKTWFASGRQPAGHSVLQPHQISTLISFLTLPKHKPLLATSIAALGPPLARPGFTNTPRSLCRAHTWFEPRWIEELANVIAEEMGPRLAKLRRSPVDLLSQETKDLLIILEPFLHLFPAPESEAGTSSHASECHRATCSICSLTNCSACKLSLFLQNTDAFEAIKTCAYGRKKKHEPWPEACGWLDPEPGVDWESGWRKRGSTLLKDRAQVQRYWKNTRHSADTRSSTGSRYSGASTDATSVTSDQKIQEENTRADGLSVEEYIIDEGSAHEDRTWAEEFPVEGYMEEAKSTCSVSARGMSVHKEPSANIEDVKSRRSRSQQGKIVKEASA